MLDSSVRGWCNAAGGERQAGPSIPEPEAWVGGGARPMLTWADEAIRMFTDRALRPLIPRDVHALIDWIDNRPDLASKLEGLGRESLREELQVLALPLVEARQATPLSSGTAKSWAWPTR